MKRKHSEAHNILPARKERTLLQAELPGTAGLPLLRLKLEMTTEPQGDGERLRLRAHVQSSFGNADAAVAAPEARPSLGTKRAVSLPARRVGALVQRGLASPLVRRLAAPLMQNDVNTWLEFHASTAALARGATALLSSSDALRRIGVHVPDDDSPLAQTWGGETGSGYAQFSLLRLDKRHLPPALVSLLGKRPFQFAAAAATTVERHVEPPSGSK